MGAVRPAGRYVLAAAAATSFQVGSTYPYVPTYYLLEYLEVVERHAKLSEDTVAELLEFPHHLLFLLRVRGTE